MRPKHGVISSMFDGIGMGLGFTLGLTCTQIARQSLVRERFSDSR